MTRASHLRKGHADAHDGRNQFHKHNLAMLCSCCSSAVKKDDHDNSDCFMCAILSHGDQDFVRDAEKGEMIGDIVCGIDGAVSVRDLIKVVNDCPGLAGKPKIFLVQVNTTFKSSVQERSTCL